MTHALDARGVASDRVDQDRGRWTAAVAVAVLGLVLGALIGALYSAVRGSDRTAATTLSVLPDPTIDITSPDGGDNTPGQDATSFIQGQLVVINGRQLAERVRADASLRAAPAIDATQIGQTYLVQISVSASSAREASRVARLAGADYVSTRERQLDREISGLLASTAQQLKAVRRSLGAARPAAQDPLTPSQTALQTEYQRLLSVRSSLEAVRSQTGRVVTVVSPAQETTGGLSTDARNALVGAVLGAVLALIVLLVVRRAVPRIRSLADLADLDVPMLLPVQPRRTLRALRRDAPGAAGATRLLAARLHAGAFERRRALVLVGTGPRVGTSTVASAASAALAGRGPVLLVRADAGLSRATPEPVPAPAPARASERDVAAAVIPNPPPVPDQAPALADLTAAPAEPRIQADDATDTHGATSAAPAEHSLAAADVRGRTPRGEDAPGWTRLRKFVATGSKALAAREYRLDPWPDDTAPATELSETAPSAHQPAEIDPPAVTPAAEPSQPATDPVDRRVVETSPSAGPREDEVAPVVPSTIAGVWLLAHPTDLPPDPSGPPPAHRLVELVDRAARAGWLVVVDAAPAAQSDLAVDCARDGAHLALVVGRGRTTPASVLASVDLFAADQAALLGVVLNDVPGRFGRIVAGRAAPAVTRATGDDAGHHAFTVDTPPWLPRPRAPRRSNGRPRPSIADLNGSGTNGHGGFANGHGSDGRPATVPAQS